MSTGIKIALACAAFCVLIGAVSYVIASLAGVR